MKKTNNSSKEPIQADWRADIEGWRKLSDETASLILDQGETLLKETIDTGKSITLRAERIITILLPVAIALMTYLLTGPHLCRFLPLAALLFLLVILCSLIFAYLNFEKHVVSVAGEYPSNLATSKLIRDEHNDHEQYIVLALSICENLQRRIAVNDASNVRRMRNNLISLRIVIIGLVSAPIVAYLLSLYLLGRCS